MGKTDNKYSTLQLTMIWLAIVLMGSFWLSTRAASAPVTITVMPVAPREGEPVVTISKLNSPSSETVVTEYRLYVNNWLIHEETAAIAAGSMRTYKYAFENPLKIGQQMNFVVRTKSELGKHEKTFATPPYSPQIWSSFVSLGSFSTSLMNYLSTMTYYQSSFGNDSALNIGLLCTVACIGLLIFMELTRPVIQKKTTLTLKNVRIRFNSLMWILFTIFLGIVYTRVVMIIAGYR